MHHSVRAVSQLAAPVMVALSLVTVIGTSSAAATTTHSGPPSSNVRTPPVVISPLALPKAMGAAMYSQQLSAAGGAGGPYTFSVRRFASHLPPGLTMSTSGLLAGTPVQAGRFFFTVRATDNAGKIGSRSYSVTVEPGMSVTATGSNGDTDTFQGPLNVNTMLVQPRIVGPIKSVNGDVLLSGLAHVSISIGSVPSAGQTLYLGTVSLAAPDGTIVVALTIQPGSVVRTGVASMAGHFVGAGTFKGQVAASLPLDVQIVAP